MTNCVFVSSVFNAGENTPIKKNCPAGNKKVAEFVVTLDEDTS
jgi:hypothetical protein